MEGYSAIGVLLYVKTGIRPESLSDSNCIASATRKQLPNSGPPSHCNLVRAIPSPYVITRLRARYSSYSRPSPTTPLVEKGVRDDTHYQVEMEAVRRSARNGRGPLQVPPRARTQRRASSVGCSFAVRNIYHIELCRWCAMGAGWTVAGHRFVGRKAGYGVCTACCGRGAARVGSRPGSSMDGTHRWVEAALRPRAVCARSG